jgi:RNA polymerase sigma factor (sigma-70 family)
MEKSEPSVNSKQQEYNVNVAAEIFAEHRDFIYAIIRAKARNREQTDDLFQNFFLSLVARPPSPCIRNIKGYLYRAIINDVIDNTRQMERYQNQVYRYAEHLGCSLVEDSPETALIEAEEMGKMVDCIEKHLHSSEAKAIILRYKNNYKIKKVAAAMGVNNTLAWRYISKGVIKIRHFFRERV